VAKVAREKPEKLPQKLKQIRIALNLSQGQMLDALELSEKSFRSAISGYELGTKEPSLITILKYSRLVNISTDYLLDDELDLPETLPNKPVNNQ
jgi:transcriptional regulator with XRE-family HTH domain